MKTDKNTFIISDLHWERIFLHVEIKTSYTGNMDFVFINDENEINIPIEFVDFMQEEGKVSFSVNIACINDRSFLENGRWWLAVKIEDSQIQKCYIDTEVAYKLEPHTRIFKYAENQMAYNVSFGVKSEDGDNLELYLDSFFMVENKHWRKRRYVKEVRSGRNKVKRFFMYASILLIRAYYHALYILIPKKGNKVMIMSETKEYLWGNLKYIDEKIKEKELDKVYRLSYSYRSAVGKHQGAKDIFSWMKVVTKVAAQDVIFVDDYAPIFGFFKLGAKTKLVQVWHAGEGFKSVGYSRFGKDGSPFPQGSCHKQYTHVITGTEHLVKVFQEVFAIEKEAFYPVGMPRLDGFLDENNIESFKEIFYNNYPQLADKKVILFAPTYRGVEQKEAYYDYGQIELSKIYEFCKQNGYAFLIKMHPFVKKLIEIPVEYEEYIYEFSKYPNINDLYYITDILITDYSSNYFEYGLMKRPVVFFTYDREMYELTRGVHRSILESAPGKVCDNFDELMTALENEDYELEKTLAFVNNNFGDYEGNASDKVVEELLLKEKLNG